MNRKDESYNDALSRIYAYKKDRKGQNSLEITFQVTEACNLNCKYCYQGEKTPKVMTLEVAKKFIDVVFREYKDKKMAIILEFIGGEPLLQADLISDIVDYWDYKCVMENLDWGKFTRFSICSNGVDYFKEASQKLINKLQSCLSFTVSIDGNKELHDSARVHADGRGSYDEAIAAAHDYENRTNRQLGSKMTIAPSNLIFLYPALKHYLDSGAEVIHANCVYENVWKIEDAQFFYKELKRLADYKLEHYPEVELSLFDERHFHQLDPNETSCWCGGRGSMLACSPDGVLYPCLRYMPSSVGQDRDDYITFGDVDRGIDWDFVESIQNITRRDTMDDECFWCPIGSGCGECAALSWQESGSLTSRSKNICMMHQARALANVYYWNKYYKMKNMNCVLPNNVTKEWALKIIDQEELDMLNSLC